MIIEIGLMICGCWQIVFSLIGLTKNFKSAVYYKVIPFFSGVFTCLCAMNMLGWVNIF